MLDKKDKLVMLYIFEMYEKQGTKLISMQQIIDFLCVKKFAVSTSGVDEIMISLSKEGLIDYVKSESKNGVVFCVELKPKGKLFKKDLQKQKKYASWVLIRTVLLTIFSFLIGLLLRTLF